MHRSLRSATVVVSVVGALLVPSVASADAPANLGCPPLDRYQDHYVEPTMTYAGSGNGGWLPLFTEPYHADLSAFDANGDGIVCVPNQGRAFPFGEPLVIDNNRPY
jgi:hypothetical protein